MRSFRRYLSFAVLALGIIAMHLMWPREHEAFAQSVAAPSLVPPDNASSDALLSFAQELLKAAHSPHKSFLIALLLIAVVYAVRRWGAALALTIGQQPIAIALASDRAGVITTLLLSLLGAVATALAAGQPINGALLVAAAGVALKAIGGYVGVRKLLGIRGTGIPSNVVMLGAR